MHYDTASLVLVFAQQGHVVLDIARLIPYHSTRTPYALLFADNTLERYSNLWQAARDLAALTKNKR